MKTLKQLPLLLTLTLTFLLTGCSNDDDTTDPPVIVNEEEIITTLTVVLIPNGGGTPIILEIKDLDGDGPKLPVFNDYEKLSSNTTYNGVITLLNETVDPAENITDEVEEESNEHQFFYTVGNGLNITTTYSNTDDNDNPLGTQLTLTTGDTSTGALTFTLRHEPKKPNDGTLSDAGGETDISATFLNVVIE